MESMKSETSQNEEILGLSNDSISSYILGSFPRTIQSAGVNGHPWNIIVGANNQEEKAMCIKILLKGENLIKIL